MCHLACVLNHVLSQQLQPKESKPVDWVSSPGWPALETMAKGNITLQTLWDTANDSKNKLLLRLTNIDIQETQIDLSVTQWTNCGRLSATKYNKVDTDKKITGLLKTVQVLENKVDYVENKLC